MGIGIPVRFVAGGWDSAAENRIAIDWTSEQESDCGYGEILSGHSGRRERYAFLAAQPPALCQAGAGPRRRAHYDPEYRGTAAAGLRRKGFLGDHQLICIQ